MGLGTGRMTGFTTPIRVATALTLALLTLAVMAFPSAAAAQKDDPQPPKKEEPKAKVGLLLNEPKACQGYTLLAPSGSTSTYLIDMQGRIVNTWKSDCNP